MILAVALNPIKVIEAMKLLLDDKKDKDCLYQYFRWPHPRCDVAIGLLQAFDQIHTDIPIIVRLTGTNERMGRELLSKNSRFQVAQTMEEATRMAVESLKKESI